MAVPRLVVITYREGLREAEGEWNLIHSRNLGLLSYGCQVTMFCVLPDPNRVPQHLLGKDYPIRIYARPTTLRARYGRRFAAQVVTDALATNPDGVLVSAAPHRAGLFGHALGRTRLVLDIHGSVRELVNYGPLGRRLVRFPVWGFSAWRWYRRFDAALVVTEYLAKECRFFAPGLRTFVVPCASIYQPEWSEVYEHRRTWRRRLGIGDSEVVLAHSGGLSAWQEPSPMVRMLKALLDRGAGARLLLATRKLDLAASLTARLPESIRDRIIARKFENNLQCEVLAAADLGLLLRADNATNRAAFPNKVDECWSVGLPVITTPGLRAVAELVRSCPEAGVVVHSADGALSDDEVQRVLGMVGLSELERRQRFDRIRVLRDDISFAKTLKPFVSFLAEATPRAHFGGA